MKWTVAIRDATSPKTSNHPVVTLGSPNNAMAKIVAAIVEIVSPTLRLMLDFAAVLTSRVLSLRL